MNENTYDKVLDEKNPYVKQLYWDIAFGLQEVDDLKPSKYLKELVDEHIEGKKSYYEVKDNITSYYKKNASNHDDDDEEEADIVATNIYEILNDRAFRFDYLTYKNYHNRLFSNLDKSVFNPGNFRTYNITKNESILNGDTVSYQSFDMIEETLKYDFKEEESINYVELNEEKLVDRICEFTSRIWQVHPFSEGNTRTTAVFIQKYLISMGFNVNNELFKENSKYFRNALVRANYTNYTKGIKADKKYLKLFFENLLFDKKNILNNDDLYI